MGSSGEDLYGKLVGHPVKWLKMHKELNMKSRQFSTLDEALQYLEDKGELKYFGREGKDDYVYSLTIGVMFYHLLVSEYGKVRVIAERYK